MGKCRVDMIDFVTEGTLFTLVGECCLPIHVGRFQPTRRPRDRGGSQYVHSEIFSFH